MGESPGARFSACQAEPLRPPRILSRASNSSPPWTRVGLFVTICGLSLVNHAISVATQSLAVQLETLRGKLLPPLCPTSPVD